MTMLAWVAALAWGWLLTMRGRFWRVDLPVPATEPDQWPEVVALIPARDEAASIGAVVASLLRQDYPGRLSVVVADDSSGDGTAEVARAAAAGLGAGERLTVVAAAELPINWRGKVWAQAAAYQSAVERHPEAEFILLTDADIVHGERELRQVIARAMEGGLDLASLMVRLSVGSLAERAVIPAFVFFFRLLYPFAWVADIARETAAAAGGYMLVRRAALDRIGGFAALKGALIDDCALAGMIKSGGGRIALDLADETRSIRPYAGFGELWMMIARSAFTQLRCSFLLLAGTVAAMAVGFLAPPLIVLIGGAARPVAFAAWVEMTVAFAPMLVYYRVSLLWAPLLPVTALFYLGATVDSARRHVMGKGGAWKGRVLPSRPMDGGA